MLLLEREHVAGIGYARAGERADRSGRDGVDADLLRTEIDGKVPNRSFQRRLRHAHHVVVRHRTQAAIISERNHGAAIRHQRCSALGRFGKRVAGDYHRADEILARGIGVTALQLVFVGEGDGVHEKIHRAPLFPDCFEHRIDRSNVLDVAGQYQRRAGLFGERFYAFGQRVTLIGESQLGAVRRQHLRNAPGNGMVVGNAHDQAALPLHQTAARSDVLSCHGRRPTRKGLKI